MTRHKYKKLSIPEMLTKLNELYDKEEKLVTEVKKLYVQYQQLQEDKEIMQNIIMHQSNKESRIKRFMK